MDLRKYLTAKAVRKLDAELVSEMLDIDIDPVELGPKDEMLSASLDLVVARKAARLGLPPVDPLTGLLLDSTPELMAERTGLEELDVQEIRRHRYDGQYPGDPGTHFLGGSNEITFGNCDGALSESYDRVKKYAMPIDTQKHQRNFYHQVGFIANRLGLPEPIKEDVCRAYTDLREKEVTEAYPLERLLGLLTYTACKIHDYQRNFDDVRKVIKELYGLSISKSDVTKKMVRAFNKGPIRFSIEEKKSGKRYLQRWQLSHGKATNHRSLGQI